MLLFALPLRHMSAGIDTLGTPAISFALVIAVLGLIYLVFQMRRRPCHGQRQPGDAGDRRRHSGGRGCISQPGVYLPGRICRRRRRHHRRLPGMADRAQLHSRRDRFRRGRLPGHVHRRARQRAHRGRGQQEPGRRPARCLQQRLDHGHGRRQLQPARHDDPLLPFQWQHSLHHRLRVRRQLDRALRPCRRRHLYQGRRRRRRPRGQGRAGHPRRRPAQSRGDRRQRG